MLGIGVYLGQEPTNSRTKTFSNYDLLLYSSRIARFEKAEYVVSTSVANVRGSEEPPLVRVRVRNNAVNCLAHGLCGTALCSAVNEWPMLPTFLVFCFPPPPPPLRPLRPTLLVSNSHPTAQLLIDPAQKRRNASPSSRTDTQPSQFGIEILAMRET